MRDERPAGAVRARLRAGTDLVGLLAELATRGGETEAVSTLHPPGDDPPGRRLVDIEIRGLSAEDAAAVIRDFPGVETAEPRVTVGEIFGKRVIVIGGGAQVAQVNLGAVSEADRHNLRGERISVDTIPLVGEAPLAAAVRAVADLPRVHMLVLAGSIMGGDITEAVKELQAAGVPVVALNMAGSVPDVADLVVSDPVQAGTMAVMAVADTARFSLDRQRGRRY